MAVWLTNRPECAYIQFAIYKIGARMVPINTRFKVAEAEYVLKQSDSVALFMMDRFVGKIDFYRDKIANVKVPRFVRFVSEFPMTAVGKIQKFKLREDAVKELGLEKEAAVETA